MGFYTDKSDKTFFPVVYVREDGCFRAAVGVVATGWVEDYRDSLQKKFRIPQVRKKHPS